MRVKRGSGLAIGAAIVALFLFACSDFSPNVGELRRADAGTGDCAEYVDAGSEACPE